jgi:hypothetical protein
MKPSSGNAYMEGFYQLSKHLETSPLNSPQPEAWCNVDRPLLLAENEALRKPIEDLRVEAAPS